MNRFKCPACGGNQYTSTEPGVGPNPPGHREGWRVRHPHPAPIIRREDDQ